MQILYLDEVDSTQTYLKNLLHTKQVSTPYAVSAQIQTKGVGSRNNRWDGVKGNLFLSFALPLESLPSDLKLESASIYFAYLLKEILEQEGSKLLLKWPNDFYLQDKKIGGLITNVVGENIVCGIGLNLIAAPKKFAKLDIVIDKKILLEKYFKKIEKKILWKKVFSKYKLEFYTNEHLFAHIGDEKVPLSGAQLEDDGSLNIDGERVYSLR
ncbi:MAG: biotin--[acetyl-CoA-carboxylase] ligase [Epsilonproteobacteria bacterium]|nr:biotin--[acetyl-CoA-carboxylase] ligase [Campylobacterota bacterium]